MYMTLGQVLVDFQMAGIVVMDFMRPLSLVAVGVVVILWVPEEMEIIVARLVLVEAEVVLRIQPEFPKSALLVQEQLLPILVMWIMLRMLGPVELQVQMEILGE
jgi:hypothetical protein